MKYSSGETVIIRGAGDIASGVALRLFRCGFNIIMLETNNPSVIRRRVAFASAVFNKEADVEGVKGILAGYSDIESIWRIGAIPVIIDENLDILNHIEVDILIDAILAKKNLGMMKSMAPLTIGLGPGFEAGVDVHAVIETNRGHNLGRVYYKGFAEKNTGTPGDVLGFKEERVLRAPCNGKVILVKDIGDFVKKGETLLMVNELEVKSKIDGIVRGIIKDGYEVLEGMKIGDVDPRGKKEYCFTVSEKALAIAGGVLEAILNFRMNKRGGESGGKGYSKNT
nr:selenium-dependent molybdenum cofactor biosynthesis protein YqeB [Caloramator mitchellensis]